MRVLTTVKPPSSPGPFENLEKRAWYPLFAHALNFPTFREFRIIPCYLRVAWCQYVYFAVIFNRTLLTMAICIESILCYLCARPGFCRLVCLPATSRQSDGTKTRQESMKLRVLASYNSCYEVIDYICSVKMVLRRQRNSSNKRWGQKRWEKG